MSRTEAPFRRTLDIRLFESGTGATLRPALHEAGCAVTPIGQDGPMAGRPDAFVADLRVAERPLAALNRARQAAGATPLIVATGPLPQPGLAEAAERHVLVQIGRDSAPVLRALGRAVRAADLAREAGVRLAALTALEQPLGHSQTAPPAENVALLADPGPLALETLHALSPQFGVSGVLSRTQALRALECGDAGALIILAGSLRRDAAALVRLIRRQSVLRDVPVVVIEKRRTRRHLDYWAHAEIDGCFTPGEFAFTCAAIRAGLRRRLMNRRLSGLLTRTVQSDAGAESRIIGSRLFDACLAERCRRGTAPFALGAVRLRAPGGAADSAALSEAAVYLSFGVGSEDLMARPAADVFLFQINSADALGAQRTVRSLATLVGDLKFGAEDRFTTFDGEAAACAWRPGEDAETLVARTLSNLRGVKPPSPEPVL